jgi:hypothetical protein
MNEHNNERDGVEMSLDRAITNVQSAVPECVAVGVVEMKTGMLLGVRTVDSHPQEVLDLVAAATGDLFQGDNVVAIEKMFKKARGVREDDHHYFREIVIFSDNLLHLFLRCNKNKDMVLVIVCRKSANLGMALVKARSRVEEVDAAL